MSLMRCATMAAALTMLSAPALAQQATRFPTDVAATCALQSDAVSGDWIKLTFPDAEGNPLSGQVIGPFYDIDSGLVYVFPPAGAAFSAGGYGEPDACAFFQWSSRMFYWLTSTLYDGKMTVKPTDPKPTDAETKYVFANEFFYRLAEDAKGDPALIAQSEFGDPRLVMKLRRAKGDDTVGQAGRTSGVLFSQPATGVSSGSSTVYYSVHTNRTYGYVRDALNNPGIINDIFFSFDKFPDTHDATCRAMYYGFLNDFIDMSGEYGVLSPAILDSFCPIKDLQELIGDLESDFAKEFPKLTKLIEIIAEDFGGPMNLPAIDSLITYVEPGVDYLSMAMEVKASWVEAATLANPERYVRQMAHVPVFAAPNEDGVMVETGSKLTELALVGMHIVATVAGHPEMVWATFEHDENTANADYSYVDASGATKSWSDLSNPPSDGWLFSNGTGADPNVEYAQFHAKGAQMNGGGTWSANSIAPAKGGQVDTASNVIRLSPWGSPTGDASAAHNCGVISTNISVRDAFETYYQGTGIIDPRMNYILTGASWGANGFPDGTDPSAIDGTAQMANTTMETFTQEFGSTVNANGCFACHGIKEGDSPFGVSHIFSEIKSVEK